ncbi:IclR family transcriptional regulator [Chelatococcus sp. GCM10030263]|uniref:IclR family transcriptional regulator n=1 Tax=Chelatococcus sp. GCM10030263 TaxID=3273387 RepID=UPI00360649A5
MSAETGRPALTRTLERGLLLLTLVAQGGGLPLIEISRRAGMSPSTALRLLETLRAYHFVDKDAVTGRYRVAIGAFEVGSSYQRQNGMSETARIVLRRLSGALRQTANLAVLDKSDIVYVERVEADGPLGTRGHWGERLPAHCTAAGKAMLAWSWESRCDEVLGSPPFARLTPNTMTDRETFMRQLLTIREQGYAVDEEEAILGVRCIAAPVLERDGGARAAISVSMLARTVRPEQESAIIDAVRDAAQRLSVMLGWQAQAMAAPETDTHSLFTD